MISMTRVKLNNSNGINAVKDYPFPVVVKVFNEEEAAFSINRKGGNIEVSFRELMRAAPGWVIPWWMEGEEDTTLMFSTGDWFSQGEQSGWSPIDDNPFDFWNDLKASRPVGAL